MLSHEVPADGNQHGPSIRLPAEVVERIVAPIRVHNAQVGRLEYYLRGEAAFRLGLRPNVLVRRTL